MPGPEILIGGIMLVALTLYALTGGADFGGGAWDLLAVGARGKEQRELISRAIAPIWEANHVWLIVVIVLLFVCFSVAFAVIMTALHIPITIMLIGIVLRGSAFAFQAYGISSDRTRRGWQQLFAVTSMLTPIALGVVLGATISGDIRYDWETRQYVGDFLSSWLQPFPMAMGLFILVLFAYLGAVYLAVEADNGELQDDFRLRGLIAAILVGIMAFVCLWLAREGATLLYEGLTSSLGFQLLVGATAIGAMIALWARRYQVARLLAITQVILLVGGFGASLDPYIVPPDLTLQNTASPPSVLWPVLIILLVGLLFIGPAFFWLYRIFKGHRGDVSFPSQVSSSDV